MTNKQLNYYLLTSKHKLYELLKIFKVIDVSLFKHSFNLEINND